MGDIKTKLTLLEVIKKYIAFDIGETIHVLEKLKDVKTLKEAIKIMDENNILVTQNIFDIMEDELK